MKKKLLSLLMAGAVVAGSSVQAFADVYSAIDTDTINAPVRVTGQVHNANGVAPSGRLDVEVPTALSFTVNQNGKLSAAGFDIKNNSKDAINVKVGSFKETNIGGGIELHDDVVGFDAMDRSNVCLVLRSDSNDVILQHGINDQELQIIQGGDTARIQVLGDAGKDTKNTQSDVEVNGVSETFDLVFKITKHK